MQPARLVAMFQAGIAVLNCRFLWTFRQPVDLTKQMSILLLLYESPLPHEEQLQTTMHIVDRLSHMPCATNVCPQQAIATSWLLPLLHEQSAITMRLVDH